MAVSTSLSHRHSERACLRRAKRRISLCFLPLSAEKFPSRQRRNARRFAHICTNIHRLARKNLLPMYRIEPSIAADWIGKKHFATQFEDGGKGQTEPVNLELNEKDSFPFNSKGRRG